MAIELYILVELLYMIALSTYILLSHEMFIKIFMLYVFDNMVDELYSLMLYFLYDYLIFESNNNMCLMF